MAAEQLPMVRGNRIYMSARSGRGIEALVEMIRNAEAGQEKRWRSEQHQEEN